MKYSSIRFYSLFLVFLFVSVGLKAQKTNTNKDTTSVARNVISIGDISEESEKLAQRLIKLKSTLDASRRIAEIDSIIEVSTPEIMDLVDSLIISKEDVSLRDLKVRKVEWTNYKSLLSQYQDVVKNRSEDISKIINDLYYDLNRWEVTKKELEERSESRDVSESIDGIIQALEGMTKTAHTRLDVIFLSQRKITDLVLIVDEEISNIEYAENQKRKDYFALDSAPIWEANKTKMSTDSIAPATLSTSSLIFEGIKQNRKQFLDFFHINTKTFFLQVIFLVLLLGFLLAANNKLKKNILTLKGPLEIQARTIL